MESHNEHSRCMHVYDEYVIIDKLSKIFKTPKSVNLEQNDSF